MQPLFEKNILPPATLAPVQRIFSHSLSLGIGLELLSFESKPAHSFTRVSQHLDAWGTLLYSHLLWAILEMQI